MSRTLFWYILKDLLRIFLMASGVLAGIMSFGGLLRPLAEYGLDAGQVGRVLAYFMPAMQTFSLPVAALFATTMVYGRLAADNELTACRASGMSYLSLLMPALVMGFSLAIIALLCLCFVVPHYNLKVEKVIVSNLAEVVQSKIQQNHRLKLENPSDGRQIVVFAQSAETVPPDPSRPDDQIVVLNHPMFISGYKDVPQKSGGDKPQSLQVPEQFFTAKQAVARIHQTAEWVEFTASVEGGVTFPRDMQSGPRGGVGNVPFFGPVILDSALREDTKFMNIEQLKELRSYPERSRKVRKLVRQLVEREQQTEFLRRILASLNGPQRQFVIEEDNNTYILQRGDQLASLGRGGLSVASRDPDGRQVKLEQWLAGRKVSSLEAKEADINVQADNENDRMRITVKLDDVELSSAEGRASRQAIAQHFSMPMPADLAAWRTQHTAEHFQNSPDVSADTRDALNHLLATLASDIQSELHSRASFGISCLILVVVGCMLGMMFKSGNFLSAFAVSSVPALLSIALIVTGQHVGEGSPQSLGLALAIIWSGNVIVLILALVLLKKLQRQ